MSTGGPDIPASGSRFTIDDAVAELKQLVDIGTLTNDLLKATQFLLVHGVPGVGRGASPGFRTPAGSPVPGGPGGPIAPGGPGSPGGPPYNPHAGLESLFRRYFGGGSGGSSRPHISRGLGGFLKHKAKQVYKTSRTHRYARAGRGFGRGLGRTLHLGNKGQKVLGKVGGVMGGIAGAAVSVVEAFVKVRNAVAGFTDAQLEAARHLAQVSGSMAGVIATRDVHQIQRDIRRGEATAESAGRLEAAENRRKNAENELGIKFDNVVNNLTALLSNAVVSPVLEGLNEIAEEAKKLPFGIGDALAELMGGGETGPTGLAATMDAIMDEAEKAEKISADMLAIAKAAAMPGGVAAPPGAAPLGGIP